MNKKEFINEISERTKVSKKDVIAVIDAFQDIVKDTVVKGDKISITGFLTFAKKSVPAKSGKIQLGDRKGEIWETPARDEISAKISKSYKAI